MESTIDVKVADRDDGSERWVVIYRLPDPIRAAELFLRLQTEADPSVTMRCTCRRITATAPK